MPYNLQLFDEQIQEEQKKQSLAEAVIQEIKQTVYGLHSKEEVTLHLQHQQVALNDYKRFEKLYESCDEVLFYLETYFLHYLDDALPVSERGIRKVQDAFSLFEIRNKFLFTLGEECLQAIIPLFLMEDRAGYTLYTVGYVANLHSRWRAIGYEETGLLDFLLTYNYNSLEYLEYVKTKMKRELENESDYLKKIMLLTKHLNHICKIPQRKSLAFCKDFPSLQDMLTHWLNKTIKQYRKILENTIPNQLPSFAEKKIETSLSVAQTAALLKLLHQGGIITNKVQNDVLQVVSRAFKSKRMEEIALGSLQNKYYNVEDKANESLKTILQNLLKRLAETR